MQTHTIEHIRAQIDSLDRSIVELVAQRQQWVVEAGRVKTDAAAVRAPDRVEAVVRRVRQLAVDAGASPEVVEALYRAMIAGFIDLELSVHRDGATS